MEKIYDVIIIGAGACGMISAIIAKQKVKKVLLLEQLSNIGIKLKASGGGRCNLTNTLSNEEFMNAFGKNGRFMRDCLNLFDQKALIEFFKQIGVETHSPDGFRIFPTTHNSNTIINAFETTLKKFEIEILCNQKAQKLLFENEEIKGVATDKNNFLSHKVIIATGGLGYSTLGASGDGYNFAKEIGHKVTKLYPAMLPLIIKEKWVSECRADTIAKAQIKINLPKAKKLKAIGDLIFTKSGIRGPIVLDFAREITPLLDEYKEVPILVNMLKGMSENEMHEYLKKEIKSNPNGDILSHLTKLLPKSIIIQICKICKIEANSKFNKLKGNIKDNFIKTLVSTPLTIIGHDGFKKAMVTRGGVSTKEIDPKTMQSKFIKGLYFCGEVIDLDGPCGGYNLQWAFSSGYLAGHLL